MTREIGAQTALWDLKVIGVKWEFRVFPASAVCRATMDHRDQGGLQDWTDAMELRANQVFLVSQGHKAPKEPRAIRD